MRHFHFAAGVILAATTVARAGPYTEAPIAGSSSQIVEWASSVLSLTRGPQDIASPTGLVASYGSASDALGPANGSSVVSLGDGGQITVAFDKPVTNGPGNDFAVFENAFKSGSGVFAELGYVDVSSDGINFFRFPSVSLTQSTTQVGGFGTIDPTDIHNLAGKDLANYGTQFDLSDLVGVSSNLNVNNIIAVRVTDVVGRTTPVGTYVPSLDSEVPPNIINDPYSTPFASGGFDLDAVSVMNEVPEPTSIGLITVALGAIGRRRRTINFISIHN